MSALEQLQDEISRNEAEICDEFNAATARNPWNRLPAAERINYLRHMIRPLAQIAVAERLDRKVYLRALHIAAHHGERRRLQGLPDSIVFEDLSFFRWAVCRRIPTNAGSWYLEAIGRIDRLLTLASAAALRGYHREIFEARGEWPDVLERLLSGEDAGDEEDEGDGGPPLTDLAWPAGEVGELVQGFLADARQWIHQVRTRGLAEVQHDGRLIEALLEEYAGALDLLDVLREELASGRDRAGGGVEALVTDASGAILFANREAVTTLGHEAHQLRRINLLELVHPDDRPGVREVLVGDPGEGTGPVNARIRMRRPNGSWIPLDLTLRPLLFAAESRRCLVRGRVVDGRPTEPPEAGRRGDPFKRHLPRRVSGTRPLRGPETQV